MAREDGFGNDHSPMGTILGLFFCVLGVASVILWHAQGGVFPSPMGWLMSDVSHTALEVGTVIVLLLGLAFAAFVSYVSRIDRDRTTEATPVKSNDPSDTAVLPRVKLVPPMAQRRSDGPDGM
jgi:hypothetical protein